MTTEQYWEGEPYLTRVYREAYRLKQKVRNNELWLQGVYVYNAFAVVLSNAFAKKGATPKKYLEKPLDVVPKTKEELEAEAKMERQKAIQQFTAWKANWDIKKKGGN